MGGSETTYPSAIEQTKERTSQEAVGRAACIAAALLFCGCAALVLACSSGASQPDGSGDAASTADAGGAPSGVIPATGAACGPSVSSVQSGDAGTCPQGSYSWTCFASGSTDLPSIPGCTVAGVVSAGPPPQGHYCCPFGCIELPSFDFVCGGAQPHYANCQHGASPSPEAGCSNPGGFTYYCCP